MEIDRQLQQYLFDLQGYLVIENALSADEVAALNALIDAQGLPPPDVSPRFGSAPTLAASLVKPEDSPESKLKGDRDKPVGAGFLEWGKPFCDLLDHESIMPVLRMCLGERVSARPFVWHVHAAGAELLHAARGLWGERAAVAGCAWRVLRLPQQSDL